MPSHFNFFGYLVAFSPIAVGHLCIPPLSYFEYFRKENDERITKIFELIYSLVPAVFLQKDFVLSLLLVKAKEFSIKSSSITHLFVHATYDHLIGNLSSAFIFGGPVCDEFGAMGLYALFLGGGLFSSLTTFLHADQLNALNELLLIEEKKSQNTSIPDRFRKLWNESGASKLIIDCISPTRSCGSSGAVCALMGCTLTLQVRDCCNMISTAVEIKDNDSSYIRTIDQSGNIIYCEDQSVVGYLRYFDRKVTRVIDRLIKTDPKRLFRNIFSIVQSVNYCRTELNTIYSASNDKESPFFSKFVSLLSTGHANHIQGIVFGVSFGCVFGIYIPYLQRRRMSMSDEI